MAWEAIKTGEKFVQVIPLDDVIDHSKIVLREKEYGIAVTVSNCPCQPRFEFTDTGTTIIIHQSWDGREGVEWVEKILGL